jgi:hypothetical protein
VACGLSEDGTLSSSKRWKTSVFRRSYGISNQAKSRPAQGGHLHLPYVHQTIAKHKRNQDLQLLLEGMLTQMRQACHLCLVSECCVAKHNMVTHNLLCTSIRSIVQHISDTVCLPVYHFLLPPSSPTRSIKNSLPHTLRSYLTPASSNPPQIGRTCNSRFNTSTPWV